MVIREAMTWWGQGLQGQWNSLRSVQEVWESEQKISAKREFDKNFCQFPKVLKAKQKSKYDVQNYPDKQDTSGKDPREKISTRMEPDSLS